MAIVKKIYLLRHGETAWTLSGQHTGITDLDLTPNGEEEAKKLGKALTQVKFDKVFCSPLKRVQQTCHLARLDQKKILDKDLLEWNYGAYEGLTSEEIHRTNPGWTIFKEDPPKGESRESIEERADRILAKALQSDGLVALFSSGHFSRALGARWLKLPVSFGEHFVLSTASMSILGFEHEKRAILLWNETSYLSTS